MNTVRISVREPAKSMYNGKVSISPEKTGLLVEVWEYLEEIRMGKRTVNLPPGASTACLRVRLPSGRLVLLTLGKPKPEAIDAEYDFFLSKIDWPDELN